MTDKIEAGLFGIGLNTYWGQFGGLLEKLTSYQVWIEDGLRNQGAEVKKTGNVDNSDKAIAAAGFFNVEKVDIINISTYALSNHCAMEIGNKAGIIDKLARLTGLDYRRIC